MRTEKRIPKGATEARRKGERGVILLLGTLSMPVLVSMMGLGIDASLVYGVKSKIQLAADGASLAAARALSIGLTTAAQATSAQNNATNWFNKNFPPGELGTSNTVLAQPQVFDDAAQPLVRHVVVSLQTDAPSYFMRYWGRLGTRVAARSEATRRDSVIMMVLDRSGSMANSGSCEPMKAAAKQFTGMFSAERDRIGMITFNMGSNIAASPTTTFKTTLGYNDGATSGTGLIDGITCVGGTGTPAATILGYNEVYKVGLPGALNVVLVFTDGAPTALALDFRGGSTNARGILENASTCQDNLNRSLAATSNPGNLYTNPRSWTTGYNMGTNSWLSNVGAGPLAVLYGDTSQLRWAYKYMLGSNSLDDDDISSTEGPGCAFGGTSNVTNSIQWIPSTDIFGTSLELSSYNALSYQNYDSAMRIDMTQTNFLNAALNASANAADRARTTRNLWDGRNFPGASVYCIGLGSGANHTLLQRMANDPTGDPGGVYYGPYTGYNTAQPVGNYVYASDASRLSEAFASIASFVLRLSQ